MLSVLTRPYCSLADVQGVAGVSDPDLDDKLVEAINPASRMIDEMCGRDFWFHDNTVTGHQIPRRSVIGSIVLLPFEIITLDKVSIDGSDIDAASAIFEEGGRTIESSGPWGAYPFAGSFEVFGTFGFALAEVDGEPVLTEPPASLPAPIRRAAALIAASLSNEWRKERVAPDGSRESLLEVRIPAEAVALLRQWDIRKRLSTF